MRLSLPEYSVPLNQLNLVYLTPCGTEKDLPGHPVSKPDVISKLEQGEDPWVIKTDIPNQICPYEGQADGRLDRKSNLDNPQSCILGSVSFHNKILKGVIKDGSLYSILKVCQSDGQLQRCQKNSLSRQVTVINNKTMTVESDYKYDALRKILQECIESDASRQRPYNYDAFKKNLKSDIDLPSCNKNNSRTNLDESFGCGKSIIHSVANSDLEKLHNGVIPCNDNEHGNIFSKKQSIIHYQNVETKEKTCIIFVLLLPALHHNTYTPGTASKFSVIPKLAQYTHFTQRTGSSSHVLIKNSVARVVHLVCKDAR
ncbi:hypothetical protein MG293_008191 [Ovis ammon polii]|uniref:KRAB domain-containing protein n=1 Tax=Ovis ammon polii TaxID=230172 RepID=A0AAD4UAJ5_OVIAM|nr:hypothetical protein MG293_008191 [Ovis ammon polii]